MRKLFLLLGLLGVLTGCGLELSASEPTIHTGAIQEKVFQKGVVLSDVELDEKGNQVITKHKTDDQYIIFVNDNDYSVSKDKWLELDKGQLISYQVGFFGIRSIKGITDEEEKALAEENTVKLTD